MQGDLTQINLPDVLRTLYVERRTGELVLTRDQQRKQIFLELGNIVFSASNQREDKLGEVLLRHGLLSYEDFDRAMTATQSGQRFGKALVEMGIMNERDLITNVTFQILDIIYSVFTWTVGTYQFIEGENRVAEELKLKLTTASIILEGVRRIEDFEIIRRGLGDLNRLISPSSSPLLRLQTISLKPVERKIVDSVTRPTDLLHILITSQSPPDITVKSVYGLLSAGILEQTQTPELSHRTGKFTVPEELQQDSQQAPPAQVAKTPVPTPPDFRTFLRDLEIIKSRIQKNNPYIILDLPPNSTLDQLNQAYYRLAERFHPDRFLQAPRELRIEIDTVFSQIVRSYELLKQRIMLAVARPFMPPPAAPPMPPNYGTAPPAQMPGTGPLPAHFPPGVPYPNPIQPFPEPPKARIPRPAVVVSRAAGAEPVTADPSNPMSYADQQGGVEIMPNMNPRPTGVEPTKQTANLDAAVEDLLAYLDDRKAPLFVADSLSMLFRTAEPYYIRRERIAEIVAGWALRRAGLSGKSVHETMLAAVNNIKHAEQARVLAKFDPTLFYDDFINELLTYCPPEERDLFLIKLGGVKELYRR